MESCEDLSTAEDSPPRPKLNSQALAVAYRVRATTPISPYDNTTGKYCHDSKSMSNKPFETEHVVIPDGKYAGLQAVIFKPATLFPFMKLPAELRIMIYRLVFQHITEKVVVKGMQRRTLRFASERVVNTTAIVRANKQICSEALPFLYHNRTFVFEEQVQAVVFLNAFRGCVRYIECIEVRHYKLDARSSLLRKLRSGRNLKSLKVKVDSYDLSWRSGPEKGYVKMAELFLRYADDWIKHWNRTRKDKSTVFPALDILECYVRQHRRSQIDFNEADFKAELQRRLAPPADGSQDHASSNTISDSV